MSTSDELPTIDTPPAPSSVKAPAPVDQVDAAAPVNVKAPVDVVKLDAASASKLIPASASNVIPPAVAFKSIAFPPVPAESNFNT